MQQGQPLDDNARIEIMQVVNEFKDRPREEWTEENIKAFCEEQKIERAITPGYLSDYVYQAKMDEVMVRIYPEIMDMLAKTLVWTPVFALTAAHKDSNEKVNEAVANIVKLLEREGVEYDYAESMIHVLGQGIETVFKTAERVTKKRATTVFEALAAEKFGHKLMTMGDVAAYSEENFEKDENTYDSK